MKFVGWQIGDYWSRLSWMLRRIVWWKFTDVSEVL
jgi:hypothetical protein